MAAQVVTAPNGVRGGSGLVPKLGIDLDETVFNTVLVWMELLSNKFGAPDGLSPEELVARYKYTNRVPDWRNNPEVEAFMNRARADHDIHVSLPLLPGAADALSRIASFVTVEYITMRPREVELATQESLRANRLPRGDLVFPSAIPLEERPAWKGKYLCDSFPRVGGIIEDNVDVVANLPEGYRGVVFLFGSHEACRSDITVIPCPTWPDVIAAFHRELQRFRDVPIGL